MKPRVGDGDADEDGRQYHTASLVSTAVGQTEMEGAVLQHESGPFGSQKIPTQAKRSRSLDKRIARPGLAPRSTGGSPARTGR